MTSGCGANMFTSPALNRLWVAEPLLYILWVMVLLISAPRTSLRLAQYILFLGVAKLLSRTATSSRPWTQTLLLGRTRLALSLQPMSRRTVAETIGSCSSLGGRLVYGSGFY